MTQHDPIHELARTLFETARNEQPSDDARRRARRGVDAQAGSALAVELGRAARPARVARHLPAIGSGFVLAAALALALSTQLSPARREAFSISPELVPAAGAVAGAPDTASTQPPAVPPETTLAPAAPVQRMQAGRPAAPPARPRAAASLAEEVAALDRARAALAAADGARALALVEEYERVLRGTRLRAEAALLRIEALAQTGRRADAAALARRFVQDHPGSPLADRARALGRVEVEGEGGR